ncbi:MAG: DUF1015 domain-containing protein [Candidatus Lokiarchaeota archaeon]|nr:DUF1015 domain-containing protein [Candidatus Lokiarchaeota archaeon]
MVTIKPFRGYRYNPAMVKDLAGVVAPPYDVISDAQRDALAKRSEHNYVHLTIPAAGRSDKYASSAALLERWIDAGVFVQDPEVSIYVYAHTFTHTGKEYTRIGFVALVEIEPLGGAVLPHEKTFPKPMEDRFKLMEANKANLEQIFFIYNDKPRVIEGILQEAIAGKPEDEKFTDDDGGVQRFWRVSDGKVVEAVVKEMRNQQCVIADGHHRYKTSAAFRDKHPEIEGARYRMTAFVNSANQGLLVLPTNRILFNVEDIDMKEVFSKIAAYFEVELMDSAGRMVDKMQSIPVVSARTGVKSIVIGMQCNKDGKSYLLKLKDPSILDEKYPGQSAGYRHLDLNVLHKLLIEECIGIKDEALEIGKNIDYVKGIDETMKKMHDTKKYQIAFYVNAVAVDEIFQVTRTGEVMPHKTTFFYPKMYSGLVFYKMDAT